MQRRRGLGFRILGTDKAFRGFRFNFCWEEDLRVSGFREKGFRVGFQGRGFCFGGKGVRVLAKGRRVRMVKSRFFGVVWGSESSLWTHFLVSCWPKLPKLP